MTYFLPCHLLCWCAVGYFHTLFIFKSVFFSGAPNKSVLRDYLVGTHISFSNLKIFQQPSFEELYLVNSISFILIFSSKPMIFYISNKHRVVEWLFYESLYHVHLSTVVRIIINSLASIPLSSWFVLVDESSDRTRKRELTVES